MNENMFDELKAKTIQIIEENHKYDEFSKAMGVPSFDRASKITQKAALVALMKDKANGIKIVLEQAESLQECLVCVWFLAVYTHTVEEKM